MSTPTDPTQNIQTYQLPDGRVIQGTPEQIQAQINEALAQKQQAESQRAQNSGIDMQEYERRFLSDPVEANDWAYQQKYGYQPTQVIPGLYAELVNLKQQVVDLSLKSNPALTDAEAQKKVQEILASGRARTVEDAVILAGVQTPQAPAANPIDQYRAAQQPQQPQAPAGAAPPILQSQGTPAGAQMTLADIEAQTADLSTEQIRQMIEQAHRG